jgi:hypothetical protein
MHVVLANLFKGKVKKLIRSPLILLLILNAVLFAYWLSLDSSGNKKDFEELKELSGNEDFSELKAYFTKLAEQKGGEYAYEVLKKANTKPGIDMHLMGHVVGEVLFKQKGADGMKYCTPDFRNACSHTIVVGLFSQKGVAALPDIIQACQKAPGGKGAYNMCFHGLGHGVLAFTGYDIEKTVDLCSKTKTGREGGREFPECVGGAVMEIISGGDHDKTLWRKQNEKYMKGPDPLFPCSSDIIPSEAKGMCYTYLTPHLFVYAGANLGNPTEEDFAKAFTYCNNVPQDHIWHLETCYGGFGKEFIVLAKARDIRNIASMTDEELSKIYKWCHLSDREDGKDFCLNSALGSLYWGGENDRNLSIRFCNLLEKRQEQDNCFNLLIKTVDFYISDKVYKENFCSEIPQEYQPDCSAII